MAKILLVDDDVTLSGLVFDYLSAQHHHVEIANDGSDGLFKITTFSYDVIVLDVSLPEHSGLEICKTYRAKNGQTPVLMLTGRDKIEHKEQGFDAGADDYLTKPFHLKELGMRVEALLKRARAQTDKVSTWRDVKLDRTSQRVTKGGKEIKLLPKEFALLEFLMTHADRVFTSEAILDRLWSSESDSTSNAVLTCISRIRTKLDDKENKLSIIRTVHGSGYRFDSADN